MNSVLDAQWATDCPGCGSKDTKCLECGQYVDQCRCPELYEAFCAPCNIVFEIDEDYEQDRLDECECENRFTDNLICEECEVYRASINDPWYPMYVDTESYRCVCTPEQTYYCDKCGVERSSIHDSWSLISGAKVHYFYNCRHYDNVIKFPDDVTVYASSRHTRKASDPAPDFAVYLDTTWDAACPAYYIDWPDYGLPTRWKVAARCIIDAYKKAQNGLWVEVGCIGGHGRTGTVLACMGVLSGMTHTEAINYVRMFYCSKSVESDEQEWYVEWFDSYINGGTTTVKTSFILGKKVDKDEEHEFKYEGLSNWREAEMIFASGRTPSPASTLDKSRWVRVPEEAKSTKAFIPDDSDQDTWMDRQGSEHAIHEYCDQCEMLRPCFCKNQKDDWPF